MSPRGRAWLFAVGALGLLVLVGSAVARMPEFGTAAHPYRDAAVAAALAHRTANVVSAVNFDQRGFDTFGEELILLVSVVGATALLRPGRGEHGVTPPQDRVVLESTRLAGYLLLPVVLVLGVDIVAHGSVTPGGGFQGGVVLASGLHLLYLAGSHRALRRLRPLGWYAHAEALSAAGFALTGFAGLIFGGAFGMNVVGFGAFGRLGSGGLVVVLNVVSGLAVASGTVVLLAQFLRADLRARVGATESASGGGR